MRSGADYLRGLQDGRQVWMLGEGRIEDVATHPLTRGMAETYALWYDRHGDPAWQDLLLTPPDATGARRPLAFEVPQGPEDLRRLGRSVAEVLLTTAGHMTHTPGYGALIALGLLDTLKAMNLSQAEIANAEAYRAELARTGRFLTFSAGGAPLGFRLREDPEDRAAIRVIEARDDGLVISGKVGMHTSSPFADDVFVSGATKLEPDSEHFLWFIIPVAAPGVRVVARKSAARHPDPEVAPLSHRFDELDAQLWLDQVFIPRERVFTAETPLGFGKVGKDGGKPRASNLAGWLFWHQHHGWLAKLEFSLGLALAAADVIGFRHTPPAVEQLIDMIIEVQTIRSCLIAAELDPELSDGGYVMPGQGHVAAAGLQALGARQKITEILRRLPGSSLVVAPAPGDFADEAMAEGLEAAFGGGGYSARQRAALLNLIWDNVSSGLDGRESTYEMHANGGVATWRTRLRSMFKDYNRLANAVLEVLPMEMPEIDVSGIGRPPPPAGPLAPAGPRLEPPDVRAARQWLGDPPKA